ncbi:MAG: DinB family protein [Pyrinomonadaceae bacterium]
MEFSLSRTVEVLSATPGTTRSLLSDLSDDWTASASREDWGPFDIVGHLIHADQTVWIPRARVIVEQGEDVSFPAFDRAGHHEDVRGKTLPQLLEEFDAARRTSLDTIAGWHLSEAQLDLQGIHPEFGPVTLRQLLATWLVHDLTHLRQIATSMAKKYESAVGPWKEYLSILK